MPDAFTYFPPNKCFEDHPLIRYDITVLKIPLKVSLSGTSFGKSQLLKGGKLANQNKKKMAGNSKSNFDFFCLSKKMELFGGDFQPLCFTI